VISPFAASALCIPANPEPMMTILLLIAAVWLYVDK
jgi:hypothetical protein